MKKTKVRSSTLFLLELIISILFFSVASAVCVQFFVRSHQISQNAERLQNASALCSSLAEMITISDSLEELAQFSQADSEIPSDQLLLLQYYDADWNACGEDNGSYLLQADIILEDSMLVADISVTAYPTEAEAEPIYSLHLQHYIRQEV